MQQFINIVGAREHNLKNVSVQIPIGEITVITGDSGSGKSSLAFDVLYAEARRKYLEAVSLDGEMLPAPIVNKVEPALAAVGLRQNWFNTNPRSLVSTVTGIGNIFRSVFELVGQYHCPVCGAKIHVRSLHQILEELRCLDSGTKMVVKAFVGRIPNDGYQVVLKRLQRSFQKGFLRFEENGRQWYLEDFDPNNHRISGNVFLIIDRIIKKPGIGARLADSLGQAIEIGTGIVEIDIFNGKGSGGNQREVVRFTETPCCFECNFASNSHNLLKEKTNGNERLENIVKKISGFAIQDVLSLTIDELIPLVQGWIFNWRKRSSPELDAATSACDEILKRLGVLHEMGLGYICLNTAVPYLSCGERRKLQIASLLFQKLTGLLFVIDEPLSCFDEAERQVIREKIKALKYQGNTVVVVEHDRIFKENYADWIIALGPAAGDHGGEIIFQGPPNNGVSSVSISESPNGGCQSKDIPKQIRPIQRRCEILSDKKIVIELFKNRNLKENTLILPTEGMVGICGPSGSGKTALATAIFYGLTGQEQRRGSKIAKIGNEFQGLNQAIKWGRVLYMDENLPRGSHVSVIATFVGVYSHIAALLSRVPDARARGITRGIFSLSRKGGRCEKCKGTGRLIIEPEFLQPVEYICDACKGKRYVQEILTIEYKGANIGDLMEMTVSDAAVFFKNIRKIRLPLEALDRIGLGYLRLGQSVSSLSGGERQRLKLGSVIAKSRKREFIILDNVSRGLSEKDIKNILRLFEELVESGHFLILVDNHKSIIKNCSWVIRMGPGSGPMGGEVVKQGYGCQIDSSLVL